MLGGGIFITQDKILPGAYINVVSTSKATSSVGARGMVAIPLPLNADTAGEVIKITNVEYLQSPDTILGSDLPENTTRTLNEVFKHATTAYIFNTYSDKGTPAIVKFTLDGTTPTTGLVITGDTTTVTQLGQMTVDSKTLSSLFTLDINGEATDWEDDSATVIPSGATITLTSITNAPLDAAVKTALESIGGATELTVTDGVSAISEPTVNDICLALESYEFNVLAAYTNEPEDVKSYIQNIKLWRDTYGKKCQLVVYNQTGADVDYEGIINVVSTVSDAGADPHALVAWVAGAEAGCEVNASCTNMKYDGNYSVICNKSQSALEDCIKNGEFVFHLVYGDVCVLEDINSLTTTSVEKGDDFKNNQTIRVVDQIANDIAKLFNTKYLGKIPNDSSGRISLWADIVKHHNQLQTIRAIQNFDSANVTVEQGETKKSIVVNDVVNPVNAMSHLYMTIVVQ